MPPNKPAPAPSVLERLGLRVLLRPQQAGAQAPDAADAAQPVRVLEPEERRRLRRIHHRAVFAAAMVGACSAFGSFSLTRYVEQQEFTWYWHWALIGGGNGVLAGLEIAFLYWDALGAVRRMAKAASLELKSPSAQVALALARAALELPSPPHNPLDVDPTREASRVWLLAASTLYKAKVLLTSFLLKALLRRALGRAAARIALDLVAVPVTALWNAVVAHRVLQEARLRVMGPDTARELAQWCAAGADYTGEGADLTAHAIGTQLVMDRDVHPNLLFLLERLPRAVSAQDFGDTEGFIVALQNAPQPAQEQALRALVAAGALDGRHHRREKRWLQRCAQAAGATSARALAADLRRRFIRGESLDLPEEPLTDPPKD